MKLGEGVEVQVNIKFSGICLSGIFRFFVVSFCL